jgi:hypothetical protein
MDNNDINGTTIYDKATGSNNLTLSGSYTTGVSGKTKEAIRFPGTTGSNYANNTGNTISGNSSFAISAWINRQGTKTSIGSALSFGASATGQSAWIGVSTLANGNVIMGGYYAQNLNTGVFAVTNTWYHVVLTYDKLTGYSDMYINGTRYVHSNANTPNISGTTICVGSVINISTNIFNGDIDNVRIYNRALSVSEISSLYNSTKINYVQSISRSSLSLDLNFGNNNGTSIAYDTGPFSLNQTEIGTLTFVEGKNGYVENPGSGVNYLSGTGTGVYNTASTTIAVKFTPDTNVVELPYRYLYDSSVGGRYNAAKIGSGASSVLQIMMGDTVVEYIPSSTYSSYWLTGQENTLIVSGASGNTNAWLNGNQILTNDATAWTPDNPAVINVGQTIAGTGYFDGKIHYMKVWQRVLTSDERDIINAGRINYIK